MTAAPAPAPPPPAIVVTISPPSGSVLLGNQLAFSATATNTADQGVAWGVNGIAGGNATVGTITAGGAYTAPAILPPAATVQITATSHADARKSASASVTVMSDVGIGLAPASVNVELGAAQKFAASISSSGHPDSSVWWSVSGAACPAACGAIDSNGNYTAPQILPIPASVTVTAQSAADPSKQSSAAVTIVSNFTLQISGPSSVTAGQQGALTATLVPVSGSNPSTALTWSVSGAGCSGTGCGSLSPISTQGSGASLILETSTYTAPAAVPAPNFVMITVTPAADPSKAAQFAVTIQPAVSVFPTAVTLAANHRTTFSAQVSGTVTPGVNWNVNGIAGGNAAVGQICVVGSNPCQPTTGSSALAVDYVAPGAIPSPNPVNVQAVSATDTTKSASAQVTVINHVLVSVLPGNVTLAPLTVQGFQASVLGTSNQSVVWQVQGTPCGAAGACGLIDANGIYTAPNAAPVPDAMQVKAISSDDILQSGTANLSITTGANILQLHPSSVYAGAAQGFTLRVDGSGFTASSPGPGSTLLIGGSARTTTCGTAFECTAPVMAADVALSGSLSVQVANPDGTKSNGVTLVVAPPNVTDDQIVLSAGAPTAPGKDIVVVDPTTAGISTPGNDLDMNVEAIGLYSAATNSCVLAGNPIPLPRPAMGTVAADICVFSQSGLDTSMTYSVSGTGDVSVIAKQPAGLGIILLTLQIPATAFPGARTLFAQNTNLDKTAASGVLEVQ